MVVVTEIQNLPMKTNTPPKPPTKANLIVLAQIYSNAYLAAGQKLFPVKAITI